jgi:hypothetical protein
MANDDQGAKKLPVRFPRNTTFTMKPGHYRALVEKLREFGVYEEALKALEDNGVRVVLRSDDPDGVSKAMATIQDALAKSPLYLFAGGFMRMAEPTSDPKETEGCPFPKFAFGQ